MEKLKRVTDVVTLVLMECPEARSNDKLLYYRVCEKMNCNVMGQPFGMIYLNLEEYGLPNPETVTRSRRKLQRQYPELSANEKVERYRMEQEEKFRKYAKAVN